MPDILDSSRTGFRESGRREVGLGRGSMLVSEQEAVEVLRGLREQEAVEVVRVLLVVVATELSVQPQ